MNHGEHDFRVERFRAAIARLLGLNFDDSKREFLAEVLDRRAAATRHPIERYLERLDADPRSEFSALAAELTVAETYFFRHADQLRAFAEVMLPERRSANAGQRPVRVLSAGCASGEEAYSLAIFARDLALDPGAPPVVMGIDLNPAMIEKALRGRYSQWALRDTPEALQRRWFQTDGRDALLDESVRAAVRFEVRNLAEDDPDFWLPGWFDVIFCRNVMMYFTPEGAHALVRRLTRALAPGGYLVLGHAENLRGLSNDYRLCHTHETFYYRRKDRCEAPSEPAIPAMARESNALGPLGAAAVEESTTWIDTIRRASDRIQALRDAPRAAARATASALPPFRSPIDLALPLELVRQERFQEALAALQNLPSASASDPDVLLLSAALLAHSGHLPRAEEACRRLLERDEMNAGAHYVLALCREGAGDRSGAIEHDQVATYLDPGFAMPRFHLGLLARRSGAIESARRDLTRALELFQREDASRVLLFGGGFEREALLRLCRAELQACGGKR